MKITKSSLACLIENQLLIDLTPKFGEIPVTQGLKLFACIVESVIVEPNESIDIPTGIKAELGNYVGFVLSKITVNRLTYFNSGVLYNCDNTGFISISIKNQTLNPIKINPGQSIGELIIFSKTVD
jgi:dUTPase